MGLKRRKQIKSPTSHAPIEDKITKVLEEVSSDTLGQIIINELSKVDRDGLFSGMSDKEFTSFVAFQKFFAQVITTNILQPIKQYYGKKELESVRESFEPPSKEQAKMLYDRLKKCKAGKVHWVDYQNICRDILTYCLVPPLLPPLEQKETEGGTHRRDIILPFPLEVQGFWKFVQYKFKMSSGIIVDCKNYSNPLDENKVVITSKYLSPNKFSTFGIVITRTGFAASAKKAQRRYWFDNGILLLCLNDDDLIRMINLREKDDDPSKVVDIITKNFLLSL